MRLVAILIVVAGCSMQGQGKDKCTVQADCLDGFVCNAGTCEQPGPGPGCTPATCQPNQCNAIDDGCGGTLQCGGCSGGDVCSASHVCGPPPMYCTNGVIDPYDGESDVDCGGSCGGCDTGKMCRTTDDCATGTCESGTCVAGRWATVMPMPTPRTMLAAVEGPDGLIYAIGGDTENSGPTNVVEAYDPVNDSWSTRAPMPTPRYGLSAVVGSDGKIYAIGGEYNSQTFTDGNSVKVEVYDPVANTWAAAPSLPDGRYMGAAVADTNGKIYETGGITVNPDMLLGSVVSLTPGGNSWTAVSDPMTTPRDGHAAATTSDGTIYVVGGLDGNDTETTTFESYAPGTPGWHTLAALPTPRKMTSAATLADKIYVVGGNSWLSRSVTYSTVVEVYDAAAHAWSRVASLPVGRFDHATVATSSGKLYVFGGESDGDSTNTTAVTFVYTPDP